MNGSRMHHRRIHRTAPRGRSVKAICAVLAAVLSLAIGTSASAAGDESYTVIDTLGAATPSTSFSVFGSGGTSLFRFQLVGPRFVLARPAVITEIGAFLNNCAVIIAGVPICPDTQPFMVEIRPAVGGKPDPASIVATTTLTHDDAPLIVSYESARPNLRLAPGEYFALFVAQGVDEGFLMDSASSPFDYLSGLAVLGVLDPTTGASSSVERFGAVRIAARELTPQEELDDLLARVTGVGPGSSFAQRVGNASAALAAGNLGATCAILDALGHEIAAQEGKSVTEQQAAALLEDVTGIRAVLEC